MKIKMKTLPKSIRESKRYFELDCNDKELSDIKNSFLYLFGAIKLAESELIIKKTDKKTLLKVNRNYEKQLILAIEHYNKIENKKIKILKKSGTIESLM